MSDLPWLTDKKEFEAINDSPCRFQDSQDIPDKALITTIFAKTGIYFENIYEKNDNLEKCVQLLTATGRKIAAEHKKNIRALEAKVTALGVKNAALEVKNAALEVKCAANEKRLSELEANLCNLVKEMETHDTNSNLVVPTKAYSPSGCM